MANPANSRRIQEAKAAGGPLFRLVFKVVGEAAGIHLMKCRKPDSGAYRPF